MSNPATLTAFLRLLISSSLKIWSFKHEHEDISGLNILVTNLKLQIIVLSDCETYYVTHEWKICYAKQRVCLLNVQINLRITMFRDDDFYTLY